MGLLGNFGTSLTLLLAHLSLFRAHREHKVHNIVLYPDKESWCKTTPIKQVVTWPQCSSQELDNNVCVGACFSYMVPHSEPSAPGDLIRPYCDSCQPLDSIWHTVTLDCKDKDDNPTTMQKKVQIITNCSCSSCMESSRIKPDLNNLLQSLELESARIAGNQPHHHHNNNYPQQQFQQQQQQSIQSTSSSSVSHLHHHVHHQSTQAIEDQQLQHQQQQTDSSQAPETGAVAVETTPVETAPTLPQQAAGVAAATATATDTATTADSNGNRNNSAAAGDVVVVAVPAPPSTPPDAITSQVQLNQATVPEGPTHEAPDLLLNPNLINNNNNNNNNDSSILQRGPVPSAKAHERFFQLFKQINDPNFADDDNKLENLTKLASLEKLEKLDKLATEYAGAKELLAKLSELLHKYSNQDEQSNGDTEDDDNNPIDTSNDEQLLQLLVSSTTSESPPAPQLPELKKDIDDEEVPSLQDQQIRVAASLLHRTGPHHSLVLDSGVKEKIDVESHYLHPALAGQEISYHDNVLHEKAHKKDF